MAEKEKSIGGIWSKQGAGGNYLSGYIEVNGERVPFIAFINKFKKETIHPDYQIYKPKEQSAPRERTEAEQRAPLNEIKSDVHTDEISPDDIPF